MLSSALRRPPLRFLLVLVLLATAQAAERPSQFPIERFLNIRTASTPALSPRGDEVAFITNITGVPQLWKVGLEGSRSATAGWPEQLTFFRERVSQPAWSPRGDWIAFSMDAGGNERWQLYIVSEDGARVRALTNEPKVIHDFGAWSADGGRIAYASNARDERFFDIYVMNVETGEPRRVYQADAAMSAVAFSPDGRKLILHRSNTNLDGDLFLLDLDSGQAAQLTPHTGEANYRGVIWGHDASGLYLLTNEGREFTNLAFLDLKSHKLSFLTNENWDYESEAISSDGQRLAVVVDADGYSELRVKELPSGDWKKLDTGPRGEIALRTGAGGTPPFTRDGKRVVYTLSASRYTSDVWTMDLAGNRSAPITHSSMAGIPREILVEPELVHYATFDGREIPAFLYRPQGREKNLPVVVWVHGGPESQFRPAMNGVIQYLVNRGFAVLAPNVRGSEGYGRTYIHLDDVEKRLDAVRDAAEGARWLKTTGIAAPDKIAVMGGSYGGYMTLASLVFHPDVWAAGIDLVGIANFKSFLQNTGPWRVRLREAEYGSLEHDAALLERISPLNHVDQIRAPLMVIAGANDPRVPAEEAEQIVSAVRKKGGAVTYLLFPDEGHGVVKLANRIKCYTAIADFLNQYLAGQPH